MPKHSVSLKLRIKLCAVYQRSAAESVRQQRKRHVTLIGLRSSIITLRLKQARVISCLQARVRASRHSLGEAA